MWAGIVIGALLIVFSFVVKAQNGKTRMDTVVLETISTKFGSVGDHHAERERLRSQDEVLKKRLNDLQEIVDKGMEDLVVQALIPSIVFVVVFLIFTYIVLDLPN